MLPLQKCLFCACRLLFLYDNIIILYLPPSFALGLKPLIHTANLGQPESAKIRGGSRTVVTTLAGFEPGLVPIWDQDLSESPKLAERSCSKGLGFLFPFV